MSDIEIIEDISIYSLLILSFIIVLLILERLTEGEKIVKNR